MKQAIGKSSIFTVARFSLSLRAAIVLLTVTALSACFNSEFDPQSFDGEYGFVPREQISDLEVELGKNLFFDKILSGNQNISCATCHHPSVASADGVALSVGEGGSGVGKERVDGQGKDAVAGLVPRNSPALFNLGSSHITTLFHDGRVELNPIYPNGVETPVGSALPVGLKSKLAVQAMFPVTSVVEMAGIAVENEVGQHAQRRRAARVWEELADRVRYNAQYSLAFRRVYGISQGEIEFIHIANAIGAFVDVNFRSTESPFDRYINGDRNALDDKQLQGMELFYGKAECSSCHSGVFQTDNGFHSIALPQVGPGKRGSEYVPQRYWTDFGRELVTESPEDRYRFRTPSLRNVELTAPYGHDGAYNSLEDIVRHHLEPEQMMMAYDCRTMLVTPYRKTPRNFDCKLMESEEERRDILASSELPKVTLNDSEVEAILAFLGALTDQSMRDRSEQVPESVFSGLPVID